MLSCGNAATGDKQQSEAKEADTHHPAEAGALSLDNGNRWKANMETTVGINNMIQLMDSFSDKDDIVAYATLKINLDNEVNAIFTNCTMTGEPHEQLHNYLLPLMDMLREVGSSDLETCQDGFVKLMKHLKEYSTYFE